MRLLLASARPLLIASLFAILCIVSSSATESPARPDPSGFIPSFESSNYQQSMPTPTTCMAPDAGGTIILPALCPYRTHQDTAVIQSGLPAGSEIKIEIIAMNLTPVGVSPGGMLGGEVVDFTATANLQMTGTGAFFTYFRTMVFPFTGQYHTAPRLPGTSPQIFVTEMTQLQGQIVGDPDFDLLRITAGNFFGMPSPGRTTLSRLPTSDWAVNSFFDITYRIDFVGNPGGPFAGMSGSTTDFPLHLLQGGPFWNPGDTFKMHYPQLPDSNGWDVYATSSREMGDDFMCIETGAIKDIHFWGSWLNDDTAYIPSFTVSIWSDVPAGITLPWSHPGAKLWEKDYSLYVKTPMDLHNQGWFDPANNFFVHPNHRRWYQYDILIDSIDWFQQTAGVIYWLVVKANLDPIDSLMGRRWGWKSSLQQFNDDAAYRQPLIGLPCVTPDNGTFTGTLPAQCPIDGYGNLMTFSAGLPPGSTVDFPARMNNMFNMLETPGGSLGGHMQSFDIILEMPMTGTGAMSGYSRNLLMPLQCQTHTGPRGGPGVQSFPADFAQLFGQITGDPDFDLLRITGGTNFGMPSPGHTTLTQLPSTDWQVESFFDITYRIDFIGAPGGPLSGMSGSTTGTIRMYQGQVPGTDWLEIRTPPSFINSLDLAFVITGGMSLPTSCCIGTTGNVNKSLSEIPDISDLSLLISYLVIVPRPTLPCPDEANINAVGAIDLSDLSLLISYLTTLPRPPLPLCP